MSDDGKGTDYLVLKKVLLPEPAMLESTNSDAEPAAEFEDTVELALTDVWLEVGVFRATSPGGAIRAATKATEAVNAPGLLGVFVATPTRSWAPVPVGSELKLTLG